MSDEARRASKARRDKREGYSAPPKPEDQPVTEMVHEYDGEPCRQSPLDHGDPVCIHGSRMIEVYTEPG